MGFDHRNVRCSSRPRSIIPSPLAMIKVENAKIVLGFRCACQCISMHLGLTAVLRVVDAVYCYRVLLMWASLSIGRGAKSVLPPGELFRVDAILASPLPGRLSKHDVIHKTEIHNVSQLSRGSSHGHRQYRTFPEVSYVQFLRYANWQIATRSHYSVRAKW